MRITIAFYAMREVPIENTQDYTLFRLRRFPYNMLFNFI